jgi:hypothetical protein
MVDFPSKAGDLELNAGLFSYRTKGFYANDDTIWVVDVCRAYQDIQDDFGFEYEEDSLMVSLQRIAISIPIIGGLMLIGTCISPCFPLHPMLWKLFGVTYICMAILQGVTLLVLDSYVCLNNPVLQYLEAVKASSRENFEDECEWGMGFKLGISATVFWAVAGISTLLISAPQKDSGIPAGLPPSEAEMAQDAVAEKETDTEEPPSEVEMAQDGAAEKQTDTEE